jgi:hypothetical protein
MEANMDKPRESHILGGPEDTRIAFAGLLETALSNVIVYSPVVPAALYDDADLLETISTQVVIRPRLRIQMLLPTARTWRHHCPNFIRALERLTSALETRKPPEDLIRDRREYRDSFAIADGKQLLHLTDPRRLTGIYDAKPSGKARDLAQLFREIWDRSEADPELRRLGL